MKQGEIWNVYFDPVKGSEQAGNRPALIVSGNALNKHLDVIIVCPLSSSIHHFMGNPILRPDAQNGLSSISEVMVFHIRSISKERFKKKIGDVDETCISEIKNTLNDLLKY